jgi:Na+-driven multidrug efflux pump
VYFEAVKERNMNEQNAKMNLLGSAPIPRALLALGLPTMAGMLINALYNLVDAYFVGGLGTDPMGAITVAYPLGQVVVGLGLLFGNGAAAYWSPFRATRWKAIPEESATV